MQEQKIVRYTLITISCSFYIISILTYLLALLLNLFMIVTVSPLHTNEDVVTNQISFWQGKIRKNFVDARMDLLSYRCFAHVVCLFQMSNERKRISIKNKINKKVKLEKCVTYDSLYDSLIQKIRTLNLQS